MSNFKQFWKTLVEKPGDSQHSEKWDRCVADVKASGKGDSAYAICTAAMKSIDKSMSDDDFANKIKYYMQKLGIAEAGPIPNTLLSRQDLEGETRKSLKKGMSQEEVLVEHYKGLSITQLNEGGFGGPYRPIDAFYVVPHPEAGEFSSLRDARTWIDNLAKKTTKSFKDFWKDASHDQADRDEAREAKRLREEEARRQVTTAKNYTDLNDFAVWYYDSNGAQRCAIFGNHIDAEAYASIVEAMGYKDIKIMKGQVEQTGKQLQTAAAKAEDVETEEEKKSLVDNIKAIQLKRQKATLQVRQNGTKKSFKQYWKDENTETDENYQDVGRKIVAPYGTGENK